MIIHENAEDEAQTIHFPSGRTKAVDSRTGTNISNADEKITILDEFFYQNLIPGVRYQISGTLMDKETGKPVVLQGKNVTAEDEFIPKEPDGSFVLRFVLDGRSLAGHRIVAFETVRSEGKDVIVHADLEDADQTIRFPSLITMAADRLDGDRSIAASGRVTVIDKVEYTNLEPGKRYTVKGELVSKETGKTVFADGKAIRGETAFRAAKSEGSTDVVFSFETKNLKAGPYVVFEELYENRPAGEAPVLLAAHKDLGEEKQTVTRQPDRPTPEKTTVSRNWPSSVKTPSGGVSPRTGDETDIFPWAAALISALAAVVAVLAISGRNRKKQSEG